MSAAPKAMPSSVAETVAATARPAWPSAGATSRAHTT